MVRSDVSRMRSRVTCLLLGASLLAGCGSGSNVPAVSSAPTAPTLPSTPNTQQPNGCRTIGVPGSYSLDEDIGTASASGGICLTISTSSVTVDCADHTIHGYLSIANGATGVSVMNCTMVGLQNPSNISNVTISNSVMSNIVFVTNGHNVSLDHNQITVAGGRPGAVVIFQDGGQNQVIGNTIDGGYHGHDLGGLGADGPGADDGVTLRTETGDLLQGNTIQNVFDAGIEGADTVHATTIANNSISHAIVAGVGSYWCTDWDSNTISGNTISDSEAAIVITYEVGPNCGAGAGAGRFSNNTLTGNSLQNPLPLDGVGLLIKLTQLGESVTSNVISGNNVGATAIELAPSSGFSDGGGNTCASGSTITC